MNTLQLRVSAPVPRSHAPAAMKKTLENLASKYDVDSIFGSRYYGSGKGKVDCALVTISAPLEAPEFDADPDPSLAILDDVSSTFAQYAKDAGVNRDLVMIQVEEVKRTNIR